ncbi:hypothetical protein [Eubacterium sp.]
MKEKLKILLCAVMIFVFSFGTCATAYAYTGYPNSFEKAVSIVNSYYKDDLTSSAPVFLYKYKNSVCLLYLPSKCVNGDSAQIAKFANGSIDFRVDGEPMIGYQFDSANMYSKPKEVFRLTNVWYTVPGGVNNDTKDDLIISCGVTILNPDGSVFFQKGTNLSPNPNPEIPPSTQGSNTLSNILNKNSTMLSGVLQEIIALLPLLLPVLITFLAIRKGIKFTLQTLRSS